VRIKATWATEIGGTVGDQYSTGGFSRNSSDHTRFGAISSLPHEMLRRWIVGSQFFACNVPDRPRTTIYSFNKRQYRCRHRGPDAVWEQ
jgi:hypothetical protein